MVPNMEIRHIKILGHGKFDNSCIPPTFVVPANVALLFYVTHGRSLEGYIGRGIESKDMHDEMISMARNMGRPAGMPTMADVTAVMRNVAGSLSGGNAIEFVPPSANCHNYRISHLGTKNAMPGAEHDPFAGSIDPGRIPEPFFMTAPEHKMQLAKIIQDFATPFLTLSGGAANQLVLAHCLFCRDT